MLYNAFYFTNNSAGFLWRQANCKRTKVKLQSVNKWVLSYYFWNGSIYLMSLFIEGLFWNGSVKSQGHVLREWNSGLEIEKQHFLFQIGTGIHFFRVSVLLSNTGIHFFRFRVRFRIPVFLISISVSVSRFSVFSGKIFQGPRPALFYIN